MSAINPNEAQKAWRTSKSEPEIQLYMSSIEDDAANLITARVGEHPIQLNIVPMTDWIDPNGIAGARAAVIEVDASSGASIKRFEKLAQAVSTPLIAAAYEPPLALVRTLLRSGARDVISLPLILEELAAAVVPLEQERPAEQPSSLVAAGKLVTAIKSLGGVGATALISQLAVRHARNTPEGGRETCLIDLDVQFGDVAFQLGLQPKLTLVDLLEAGARLDGDLLRATTTEHSSGLRIIAAPPEMMPIEGMPTDHLLRIVELAKREFGTVFLDLPSNWTNWSLSLVAQSDLALMVTELSVAGINRAKRQLALLQSQDLGGLDVRIVANRFDKAIHIVRAADVRDALGRDVALTITNDSQLMRMAIDRGVPIHELKRKSGLGADIDKLDLTVTKALGLEQ